MSALNKVPQPSDVVCAQRLGSKGARELQDGGKEDWKTEPKNTFTFPEAILKDPPKYPFKQAYN